MKLVSLYIIIFSISLSAYGQLDNRKTSVAIPAVETKKETESKTILPAEKKEDPVVFGKLDVPDISATGLNTPKKSFSLYEEEFGNPGDLYKKQIDKNIAE